MPTAEQVADYILSLSRPEVGDIISNLKLQKLLYYCQGFHLAMNDGNPLFDEDIEAWNYGPVVPSVYHKYKDKGSNYIDPPDNPDLENLTTDQKELIEDVYTTYGQFSAWRLMEMTHDESPWKRSYNGSLNRIITKQLMEQYFRTQVVDGKE